MSPEPIDCVLLSGHVGRPRTLDLLIERPGVDMQSRAHLLSSGERLSNMSPDVPAKSRRHFWIRRQELHRVCQLPAVFRCNEERMLAVPEHIRNPSDCRSDDWYSQSARFKDDDGRSLRPRRHDKDVRRLHQAQNLLIWTFTGKVDSIL